MQLQDKVIIVTGGGQGLGRAMAEYLASKGARLALVDLNQERLDEAVAACKPAAARHAPTCAMSPTKSRSATWSRAWPKTSAACMAW